MTRSRKYGLFLFFALALAACTEGGDDPRPDAAPPAPEHSCKGESLSCYETSGDSCYSQLGCSRELDECSGVSRSCYSYFDSFSCDRQPGCYWSFSSDDCQGSSWSCNLNSSESSCGSADGCNWNPGGCTGVAFRCSELHSEDFCNEQIGCYWE